MAAFRVQHLQMDIGYPNKQKASDPPRALASFNLEVRTWTAKIYV